MATGVIRGQCPPKLFSALPWFSAQKTLFWKRMFKTKILPPKCVSSPSKPENLATGLFFSLRHLVICLTVVSNSPRQCSSVCIFRRSDRNNLIFFSHFKNVSVGDRKTNSCGLGGKQMAKHRWTVEIDNVLKMSLWWYRWYCAKGMETIATGV